MTVTTKNKVLILKYKTIFEENILVSQELNEGTADLAYHLNYFKKRLSKTKPMQDDIFNQMFFGRTNVSQESKNLVTHLNNQTDKTNKQKKQQQDKKPEWAKKLYKKIVYITHPDKLTSISIDLILQKFNDYYMLAVSSYEKCEYHNLIMIGYDLGIKIDNKYIEKNILPNYLLLEKSIIASKNKLGYQWHHVPEKNRQKTLEEYLTKMGFVFTKDQVENAISSARKKRMRKVGTRPIKMKRMRLK